MRYFLRVFHKHAARARFVNFFYWAARVNINNICAAFLRKAAGLGYSLRVPAEHLQRWVAHCGWETVLNRRGTTWRKLSAEEQASAKDAASAQVLMQQHPSLIKRPVVEWPLAQGPLITVGWDAQAWAQHACAMQNV